MKFLFYLVPLICISVFMTGCGEDAVKIDTQEVSDNTHVITEMKAIEIASDAMKQFGGVESRSGNGAFHIASVIHYGSMMRSRDEEHVGFYVINYENGGYVLVADDDRVTSVYAISETGQYDMSPESPTGYFLELATVAADMERDGLIEREQPISTLADVDPLPFRPDTAQAGLKVDHGDHICLQYAETTTSQKFNILQTCWHQENPFNRFCLTPDGKRTYAGCGPVAMGQIMAYLEKPTSFNGHEYPMSAINHTEEPPIMEWIPVGYLINDIGLACDIKYRTDESLVDVAGMVEGFNAMGFNSVISEKYDFTKFKNDLSNKYPVIVAASDKNSENGHVWVIDGYYADNTEVRCYRQDNGEMCAINWYTTYYVHCNWGQTNKSLNGFFYDLAFRIGGYDYTRDIYMIYNIR